MERMMPNMITEAMALHASRTFGHFLLNAIRIAAKKETPTARNGLQSMIVISETPPAIPV